MKVTIELEQDLIENIKKLTGEQTQAEAVQNALQEWLRIQELRHLRQMIEEQPFEFHHSAQKLRSMNQSGRFSE